MSATQLRSAVARLAAKADADMAHLWRQVSDAVQAREALKDLLPAIVDRYGSAAAVLAAEWYDQQRLKAGVPGSFRVNAEANLNVMDPDFAAGQIQVFENDLSHARQITLDEWQHRPSHEKAMENFATFFGWLM